MAISSAVLGMFLIILVVLFVFIAHYVNPTLLRTAPQFQSNAAACRVSHLPVVTPECSCDFPITEHIMTSSSPVCFYSVFFICDSHRDDNVSSFLRCLCVSSC